MLLVWCKVTLFLVLTLTFVSFRSYAQDEITRIYDFGDAMVNAVDINDVGEVERLIASGYKVNSRGSFSTTPLMRAAYLGNLRLVDLLLKKGATVDLFDYGGATALHFAIRAQDAEVVNRLILAGANVNFLDKQRLSPLYKAVSFGAKDIVEGLLKSGADQNLGVYMHEELVVVATEAGNDLIAAALKQNIHDVAKKKEGLEVRAVELVEKKRQKRPARGSIIAAPSAAVAAHGLASGQREYSEQGLGFNASDEKSQSLLAPTHDLLATSKQRHSPADNDLLRSQRFSAVKRMNNANGLKKEGIEPISDDAYIPATTAYFKNSEADFEVGGSSNVLFVSGPPSKSNAFDLDDSLYTGRIKSKNKPATTSSGARKPITGPAVEDAYDWAENGHDARHFSQQKAAPPTASPHSRNSASPKKPNIKSSNVKDLFDDA